MLSTIFIALGLAAQAGGQAVANPAGPEIRGVLFHSPSCPHCRTVLARDLPPLEELWGTRLNILRVDVSDTRGAGLYRASVSALALPEDRRGVPMLLMGTEVMLGSGEIPARLPGAIQAAAETGLDWPRIPGLDEYLTAAGRETAPGLQDAGQGPPSGAGLAWAVLALLVLSLVGGLGARVFDAGSGDADRYRTPPLSVALIAGSLVLMGLGVSGYLALSALQGGEAVCGPVGDCAAVHASPYATVLGVPVAILGVLFFGGVGVLWLALSRIPQVGGILLAASLGGVVFSLYLTVLELFVIRAVCLWCLASAASAAGIFGILAVSVPWAVSNGTGVE